MDLRFVSGVRGGNGTRQGEMIDWFGKSMNEAKIK